MVYVIPNSCMAYLGENSLNYYLYKSYSPTDFCPLLKNIKTYNIGDSGFSLVDHSHLRMVHLFSHPLKYYGFVGDH